MINPRTAKVCIFGLQGSGKTFYAKECVKRNKMKVLVFSPHWHDFSNEPDENFYYYDGFGAKNIEKFYAQAKKLCKAGVIDGVLIDEFDMICKNNFEIGENATDVFANHRHYNMAIIALARRAQDIPAYFVESCKFIVSFALDGANAKTKLNGIYRGFGDMVGDLHYESHEYVLKSIGQPPQKMPKI